MLGIFKSVFFCVSNTGTAAHGSGFLCGVLVRDVDPIDKSGSDITQSPICPGPFASVLTLASLSSPAFLSNLIHQGNCQLGASEARGLQKIL